MSVYSDLIEEEKAAADKFAAEHKISKEIAAVIIRSSDEEDKRLDALKIMQAAFKSGKTPAGKAAQKKQLEEEINLLTEKLIKAQENKDVPMMVKLRNLQQIKVNELKVMA